MYFPALTAIHLNPALRPTYERLIARGKPRMVVVAAIMRKLLVLADGVLKSAEPFKSADAKSLVQLLSLGAEPRSSVTAEIEGEDDSIAAALAALHAHLALSPGEAGKDPQLKTWSVHPGASVVEQRDVGVRSP